MRSRRPNAHGARRIIASAAGVYVLIAAAALMFAALSSPRREAPGTASHSPTASTPSIAPVPVLAGSQSLERFQIKPGFRVELAAAEPMIESPVAGAFDEFGRLWVVEMRTYMPDAEGTGELAPRNRIVILRDSDGDGVFDESSVFLDDLVLPRAVAPCFGGALVIEPPNLLFCKDTDGDGRADERRVVLDGFGGRDNPEHAANGLIYGIDNRWELSQHGVRIRFDSRGAETQRTPSHGQWGVTRDDQGRLFYTPNSNALLADLFPKQYAARFDHPSAGSIGAVGRLIAPDSSVWPAIANPSINRGYRENTFRADGTLASLTAACGPTILRSPALGSDFAGSAFLCEPAGNLVKRLLIDETPDGSLHARNAYDGSEFLRSTDERFRPVNTLVAPDGSLIVLDMYRGLIQHRMFLTPHLKQLTLSRGMDRPVTCGRIWRITRDDPSAEAQATESQPKYPGECDDHELVELLSHPDGWWRDTAQRLLVERRAVSVERALRSAAFDGGGTIPRLHAVHTLDGLGLLGFVDIATLTDDSDPLIRVAGLRILERFSEDARGETIITRLIADSDSRVRVQAVLGAGSLLRDATRAELAARFLANEGNDDDIARSAARAAIGDQFAAALRSLTHDDPTRVSPRLERAIRQLADDALRATPRTRSDLLALAADMTRRSSSLGSVSSVAEILIERVRGALRLETASPSTLKIAEEPRAWIDCASDELPGAASMRECLDRFEWPGRPATHRVRVARELTSEEWDRFARGKAVFATTCAACHQSDGRGSAGLAPSLENSAIANGPSSRMIRALMHGLEGGYMPAGGSWGVMPATPVKDADDLAAVLTFVRRSFNNAADPVTPAAVARVREQTVGRTSPWNRGELEGVPE